MKFFNLTLGFLLLAGIIKVQGTPSVITFTKHRNVIANDAAAGQVYTLPLTLQFSKDFKDLDVEIYDLDKKQSLALKDSKFGSGILSKNDDQTYSIIIKADNKLKNDEQQSVTTDSFMLQIAGKFYGPFKKKAALPDKPDPDPPAPPAVTVYTPGYLYYDVIELKQLIAKSNNLNTDEKKLRTKILNFYGINSANLSSNPLIQDVIPVLPAIVEGGNTSNTAPSQNSKSTAILDALAKFLVERSKEELNIAFFSKFQTFITSHPELKIVFPATAGVLGSFNSYQYTAMLPALRAAFNVDLNLIPANLINLRTMAPDNTCDAKCQVEIAAITDFLTKNAAGRGVMASLVLTDNLIKGNDIAVSIDAMAADEACQTDLKDGDVLSNTVQLANLLSQSFRSTDNSRVWITRQQVAALVNSSAPDQITIELFLGLFVARADQLNITFKTKGGTTTPRIVIEKIRSDADNAVLKSKKLISSLQTIALTAAQIADEVQQINNLKTQAGKDDATIPYIMYAKSISGFMNQSENFLYNCAPADIDLKAINAQVMKYTEFVDKGVALYYDISTKSYGALALHSAALLTDILPAGRFSYNESFVKYSTFMANVVQAQNSDEVKAAIEATVLPVGSSSIKRETDVNIALNAYIGPSLGWEYIPKSQKSTAGVVGITAPVGVAFSWGNLLKSNTNKSGGGKSSTLFVSLIDIGALASYRIKDNTTDVSADIQIKNVVSPGLFYYFGFGKCPVSLGVGAQLGPQLRSVTNKAVTIDNNYYFKYGVSLVVDIPLLNLYTKSKE